MAMEFVIEGLKKSYDQKLVLDDVSYEFSKGKIYALLGRNGAGKTTLFNCISSDIEYEKGNFYFIDQEKEELRPSDVGYVLSTPEVPEFLTAYEFLKFFLEINESKIQDTRSIEEYLALVNIDSDDAHKLMKHFSHGMKNKMQMLVNIIARPKLLLLDEPLTSLDVVASEEMKELLRKIKNDSIIILSTHILDLALDLCDEIVLLSQKKLSPVLPLDLDDEGFKEKIIQSLRSEE